MLKALRRFFGEAESPAPAVSAFTESPRVTAGAGQRLAETSFIGQTLVATVIEPDLTGERVAELAFWLREEMARHASARNLVLDLHAVEYLDSACLNLFVELLQGVRRSNGQIAIATEARRVEVLFKLTRLDQVFPVRKSVLAAIDAVERVG